MSDEEAIHNALNSTLSALRALTEEQRIRVIKSIIAFYDLGLTPASQGSEGKASSLWPSGSTKAGPHSRPEITTTFGTDRSPSPKSFLMEKRPLTDVERIAVLAYYLTHYRDMPHFKTLDLSKLNTEAAQPKFTNAANASNNAVQTGYLVPAQKGMRQLSGGGERFVEALPNRDAARSAIAEFKARRSKRIKKGRGNS